MTQQQPSNNTRDPKGIADQATHCPRGHTSVVASTRHEKNAVIYCSTCDREYQVMGL